MSDKTTDPLDISLEEDTLEEGMYPEPSASLPSDLKSAIRTYNNVLEAFKLLEEFVISTIGTPGSVTPEKAASARQLTIELTKVLEAISKVKFNVKSDKNGL